MSQHNNTGFSHENIETNNFLMIVLIVVVVLFGGLVEIVPLFYDRVDGVPVGWVARMQHNWKTLGPFVTASRMVRDYTTDLYEPAAASARLALGNGAAVARELSAWKSRVAAAWGSVRVLSIEADTTPAHEGDRRRVVANLDIDGLEASDVAVQALHGPIDSEGEFIGAPQMVQLTRGDSNRYEGVYVVGEAGPYGLAVRALPHHPNLISPVEMGIIAWAV